MEIVCLANSAKGGGRCVAGIDLSTGRWVRPVGDSKQGELTALQSTAHSDGPPREVRALDVVDIGQVVPRPEPGQPENFMRGTAQWMIKGQVMASTLTTFATRYGPLLHGTSDRVSSKQIGDVPSSLALIEVENPQFRVNSTYSKSQLRAIFSFDGQRYDLSVTDLAPWTSDARRNPELDSGGNWIFTISLGTEFNGAHYKLVACGIRLDDSRVVGLPGI